MEIKELGHVVLYVRDLERSADFYGKTLGFQEIARRTGLALFSSRRTHHELLLIEVGGDAPVEKSFKPGLYHIGFKIGDNHDTLVSAHRELIENGVRIVGTGDHTVTHSLYIEDPDGNEIELYVDISDEWKRDPQIVLTPVKPLTL